MLRRSSEIERWRSQDRKEFRCLAERIRILRHPAFSPLRMLPFAGVHRRIPGAPTRTKRDDGTGADSSKVESTTGRDVRPAVGIRGRNEGSGGLIVFD